MVHACQLSATFLSELKILAVVCFGIWAGIYNVPLCNIFNVTLCHPSAAFICSQRKGVTNYMLIAFLMRFFIGTKRKKSRLSSNLRLFVRFVKNNFYYLLTFTCVKKIDSYFLKQLPTFRFSRYISTALYQQKINYAAG